MKTVAMVLFSLTLYAIQNVIFEQKLARYSAFAILVYMNLAILPLSAIGWWYVKTTNPTVEMPSVRVIVLMIAVSVVCFAADVCRIGAYTNGGNIFTITTLIATFPVLVALVRFLWVGGLPNRYHVLAYLLTFAAVWLVTKGNQFNE